MEHTPGPWGWTYDGSSDYSIGEARDPQAYPVAHIWDRNDERAMANASLIAAAPELLAVAKALDEYQRTYHDLYSNEAMRIVRAARAAIVKAKAE